MHAYSAQVIDSELAAALMKGPGSLPRGSACRCVATALEAASRSQVCPAGMKRGTWNGQAFMLRDLAASISPLQASALKIPRATCRMHVFLSVLFARQLNSDYFVTCSACRSVSCVTPAVDASWQPMNTRSKVPDTGPLVGRIDGGSPCCHVSYDTLCPRFKVRASMIRRSTHGGMHLEMWNSLISA